MDEVGLIILLAGAVLLSGIVGFILGLIALNRISTLRYQISVLAQRLRALEDRTIHASARSTETQPETKPETEAPPAPEAAAPQPEPTPVLEPEPVQEPEMDQAARETATAAPEAPAPQHTRSLEETLGTRIAVWVGGIALMLGGVFLVRYSIEAGLLGPGARIAFGALFSIALLAGGEWLRRRENQSAVAGIPAAHVPGIVTAAGTVSAFATIYAAYALYGFLSPAVAFVLLALIAIVTLLASALHGPILAAIGLLAATAAPALVSTGEGNAWALFAHLTFVTAAALGVARLRSWSWLALAAGVAGFGWAYLYLIMKDTDANVLALAAYSAAMLGLFGFYHATGDNADKPRPDWIVIGIVSAFGIFALVVGDLSQFSRAGNMLTGGLILLTGALAIWQARLAPLMVSAAVLALLAVHMFGQTPLGGFAPSTVVPDPSALPDRAGALLVFALVLGGGIGAGGLWSTFRWAHAPMWITGCLAGGAVAAPVALLASTYWSVTDFAPHFGFAVAATALAVLFAVLAERFAQWEADAPPLEAATAALATGAVAAVGLALTMTMREGFLTVSLAFVGAGIAWVHASRPIRALPVLAMLVGAVVLVRTGLDPFATVQAGTTPIFNALLWVYGVPALAFAAAAVLFGRHGAPRAQAVFEGLALIYATLLVMLQIRHWATGGDMTATNTSLLELGLQVTTGCVISVIAQRLAIRRASRVLDIGAMAISALALIVGAFGLLVAKNPLFSWAPVGRGLIFNDLLPGYLAPALAAAFLMRASRGLRPDWYRTVAGVAAGALAFVYLSLEVRAFYHRPVLASGTASEAELYTYSVVWLVFGIALLLGGLFTHSQAMRIGSAALIVITVLKVFLFDMANLEGPLRALSFIGLGGVLIGIGLLYQRLLYPMRKNADA